MIMRTAEAVPENPDTMGRLLVVRPDARLEAELAAGLAHKPHEIEYCDGEADALSRLADRAADVLVTSVATSIGDDLALFERARSLSPRLRMISLASTITHVELIAALSGHVFAVFASPLDYGEIVGMSQAALAEHDWHDGIEVVSALPQWMTLKVACHLLTAERVIRYITEHESAMSITERDLLMAAFREILVNAMEHGGGFNPSKYIEVTAARTQRAVVFHFRDPGDGFDRTGIAHAAASPSPEAVMSSAIKRAELGMRPGGFGMLIVRQIVDEVVYNERGNEVLLIKHLS
jgi:anti-sigma regulatory factor (Ser/Thr protein kinase)